MQKIMIVDEANQIHKGMEETLRREGHDVQVIRPAPLVVQVAGTERNKPCPCGSGKKAKRCEHTIPQAPYEISRRRSSGALAALAIASLLAVPARRRR